jgi:hypothetical protein
MLGLLSSSCFPQAASRYCWSSVRIRSRGEMFSSPEHLNSTMRLRISDEIGFSPYNMSIIIHFLCCSMERLGFRHSRPQIGCNVAKTLEYALTCPVNHISSFHLLSLLSFISSGSGTPPFAQHD